jgi:hypothetical protein
MDANFGVHCLGAPIQVIIVTKLIEVLYPGGGDYPKQPKVEQEKTA